MANLGDISKIQLPNGDVVNIKGTSSVVEGYISSNHNKFYSDSAKTIEIAGEANKLYVDRTHASTDGYSLYKWAYNDDNSSFVRAGSEVVKGEGTYGIVKNGSSVTSATGYTACPIISGVPYYKDTTYESKSAVSGGTAVSLCTTGEKYTWNNKQSALNTTQLIAVNSGIDSTKVAQIATNKNNILWSKTSLQYSATAANTYEYTGLSIACPANTLLEIWAIDDNSNSRIIAIAVTDSKTSIDATGSVIGENAEPLSMVAGAQWAREVHCVTPRLYGSVHTYYVWVKRGSTGANNVTLLTRKIVTA